MPGAKNFIQWRSGIAVVQVEVLVMQLVIPIASAYLSALQREEVETGMRWRGPGDKPEADQHDDERVHGDKPDDDEHTEIKQMFDGMHRHARPWASVDITMV